MPPSKSLRPATARPVNEPLEFECVWQHLKSRERHLRLQWLSERLHALGSKPSRGDVREMLETCAALSAELIAAYGGDRCAPMPRAIDGGSP
jgi:hypothetical protein